jgi:hypothetical protein
LSGPFAGAPALAAVAAKCATSTAAAAGRRTVAAGTAVTRRATGATLVGLAVEGFAAGCTSGAGGSGLAASAATAPPPNRI